MDKCEAMAIYWARLVNRGAKTIEEVPEQYRDLARSKTKTLEPLEYEEIPEGDSSDPGKEGKE